MLRDELAKVEQDYQCNYEFGDPFGYEHAYGVLKRCLLELLETKISYWQEIAKKKVRVSVLRKLGSKFLKKFGWMHEYYLSNVQNL